MGHGQRDRTVHRRLSGRSVVVDVTPDVARRHRELGLRMAIGARATDIVRLVLAEGVRTLVAGVVVGAALRSS